jgi:hypothetical protein
LNVVVAAHLQPCDEASFGTGCDAIFRSVELHSTLVALAARTTLSAGELASEAER